MALENLLSTIGMGTKQITDRYSEYGAPMPDQHVYYAYEPQQPAQTASSKHHHSSGGGLKTNASMSALTLLAFLFFLHILQQCIKEHMTEMSTAPIMVMTAGREGEAELSKTAKNDKTGITEIDDDNENYNIKIDSPIEKNSNNMGNDNMMRINAADHKPSNEYENIYKKSAHKTSFPGFVSAMDKK